MRFKTLHKYQITFRGCMDLRLWNRLLRQLYDLGINYQCESKLSPTRDDAGMLKYYETIVFLTENEVKLNFDKIKLR